MSKLMALLPATAIILSGFLGRVSAAELKEMAKDPTNAVKEVLLRKEGKDRHWVIRTNGLIVQEHYLTAHGDLHVMIEYAKGVQAPQVDAPKLDTNAGSVTTVFWRSGSRMSRTPAIGGKANGEDYVWWPNGQVAREGHFVMGAPDGLWKYFDENGRALGNGIFAFGRRQSGVFFGSDNPGGDFFLTDYPMKKSRFENGQLKEQQDWLIELKMP